MFLFKVTYTGSERAYIDCFTADNLEDATRKAEILTCGASYRLEVIQ